MTDTTPEAAGAAGLAAASEAETAGPAAGPGFESRPDERPSGPDARRPCDEVAALQAERVRSERMATLGWLAASVGHDLRTPLGAIRANSELALRVLDRLARTQTEARSSGPRPANTSVAP